MRKVLTLALALVAFVAVAQESKAQSSRTPGMSTVKSSVATPISKSGIVGSILDGYGNPVRGAELVVSLERLDADYRQYVDLDSTKRFGQCTSLVTQGCIQPNGNYEIPISMLPNDGNQWFWINIRAEAPNGFIQGIWDTKRYQINANGRPEYVYPIYMYDYGFATYQTTMWWESQDVVVIGTLVRSPYSTDVSIGFIFEGSSLTKTAVKYGQINTGEHIDSGWTWIEKRFYAPQTSNLSYYNGAFCGEMQITSTYSPEWVYDNTKKVCVAAR